MISDDNVAKLYGEKIRALFPDAELFVFPHGEKSKNLGTFSDILSFLSEKHFNRGDNLAALGGGVAGDLTGFTAACYMRGVKYIQIPTTLLAMIDSSVGGKTAVDAGGVKNLAGAFYNPSLVVCDTAFLKTLPARELACGFAEMIKTAVLSGEELFGLLENADTDSFPYSRAIGICVRFKSDVVSRDFRDSGERNSLNLGHTFGHAIEALSDYTVPHGFAVAEGLVKACEKGGNTVLTERVIRLLKKYGLPTECPFSDEELYPVMRSDKKAGADGIRLIIPEDTGTVRVWTV